MTKNDANFLISYYCRTDLEGRPENTIYRTFCKDDVEFIIYPKETLYERFYNGRLHKTTWIICGTKNQETFLREEMCTTFRFAQASMLFRAAKYDIVSASFTKKGE